MTEISDELKQFFRDYLTWAEGGHTDFQFSDGIGLCSNCLDYGGDVLRDELSLLLEAEFQEQQSYPFGGHVTYWTEVQLKSINKNEERLAFVRKWAA